MSTNRIRVLLVMLAVVAASMAILPGTAVASPPGPDSQDCWVRNTNTGVVGSELHVAIRDSSPGDRLRIRGTCHGGFQISRDIILQGPATLSGEFCYPGGCDADIVLNIYSGKVKLKNLVITDGYSTHLGGGIYNSGGDVTLSNTAVRGNWAEDGGGGILNDWGTMRLNWHSSVTDNWLLYGDGGGISNHGKLILNAWSRVERNDGAFGGGIHNTGRVVLNRNATVTDNHAEIGGGVLNEGVVHYSPRWNGTLCGNDPDDWPGC